MNGSRAVHGSTLTARIESLVVAAVVYLAVVVPRDLLREQRAQGR